MATTVPSLQGPDSNHLGASPEPGFHAPAIRQAKTGHHWLTVRESGFRTLWRGLELTCRFLISVPYGSGCGLAEELRGAPSHRRRRDWPSRSGDAAASRQDRASRSGQVSLGRLTVSLCGARVAVAA
jgi:hypothetical protein